MIKKCRSNTHIGKQFYGLNAQYCNKIFHVSAVSTGSWLIYFARLIPFPFSLVFMIKSSKNCLLYDVLSMKSWESKMT